MEENNHLEIQLNPNGVYAPLVSTLENCSNTVLFGLQLLDSAENIVSTEEITTEDIFNSCYFDNSEKEIDVNKNKSDFKIWILQKAFEDIVKGLNLSLIEAYFYNSLIMLYSEKKTVLYSQLVAEIDELKKSASKQHLPELIKEVKSRLTGKLDFEDEITSFNKLRNCLVHRNGIVTLKDINDTENNRLNVKYCRAKVFYIENNEEIEVVKYSVINSGATIQMKFIKESFYFEVGEKVSINFHQFNDVLVTCMQFGLDLINKLKTEL